MRNYQRLSLAALLLLLVVPYAWLSSPPTQPLTRARKAMAQPIEVAFENIRVGMTERELFTLMAPFRKVFTGHGQWPCWTDGRFVVLVTIWAGGGPLGDIPEGVLDKQLYEKQLGGTPPN